jgi:hypothetical protein
MRILKLCKKEGIFINNSAIANLIYVNRLNKREIKTKREDKVLDVYEETKKYDEMYYKGTAKARVCNCKSLSRQTYCRHNYKDN